MNQTIQNLVVSPEVTGYDISLLPGFALGTTTNQQVLDMVRDIVEQRYAGRIQHLYDQAGNGHPLVTHEVAMQMEKEIREVMDKEVGRIRREYNGLNFDLATSKIGLRAKQAWVNLLSNLNVYDFLARAFGGEDE